MAASLNLGTVTAPSGVLVLGMAGWMDYWPQTEQRLPQRAHTAAAQGGGHLRDALCEAVAVPAADDRPLHVRASTAPSPFDDEPTIAILEVELGTTWPRTDNHQPIPLGELPVDRCGMVLGDADALDSFVGLGGSSIDGLADLTYWGHHAAAAQAVFGGGVVGEHGSPYGWLDLSVEEAHTRDDLIRAWVTEHHQGRGLMTSIEEHTDYTRLMRAGWDRPLHCGVIELAGCCVLGIEWDQGDHSMRHRGERPYGQVYPVTLHRTDNHGTALRWTIPPYAPNDH